MTARELRQKYLDFFKSKGHTIIPSASLVPKETDPSVLFTTAGMHPLVPYLLGEDHPGGKRVANVQKCIRTGDIDDVGDNRHNTFFEMMGNWSFGDYFKKEAIEWSWEFLTDEKWLGLDPQRIYATVFKGENSIPRDEESIGIWKEIFQNVGMEAGVAGEDEIIRNNTRIIPLDAENNFWIAAATGPCGPDTEMFYDTRPEEGKINGTFQNLVKSGRLIEIWNNVFMEYEKKKKERIVLLIDGMFCLYGKDFNLNEKLFNVLGKYDVKKILVVNGFRDKAKELLKEADIEVFSLEEENIKKEDGEFFEKLKAKYGFNSEDLLYIDHDENNIKGAQSAGITKVKFYTESEMEDSLKFINESLYYYEKLKQRNVDTGMGVERTLAVLNGKETVFDTELFIPIFNKIEEISATSYKLQVTSYRIIADHIKAAVFIISDGVAPSNTGQGYVVRRLIRRAVRYARLIGIKNNFVAQIAKIIINIYKDHYKELNESTKNIFEELENEENKFFNLLFKVEGRRNKRLFIIDRIRKGEKVEADKKWIENDSKIARVDVLDKWNKLNNLNEIERESLVSNVSANASFTLETTHGYPHDMFFEDLKVKFGSKEWIEKATDVYYKNLLEEHIKLSRTASAGMFKGGLVDAGEATAKLHTATHLLLAALREVLGSETYQKGSNITAERLRFDFNYPQKLTSEQIKQVEDLVNEKIKENILVEMTEMPKDEALKIAKVSFDPGKYGEIVKVYKIGDPSNSSGQAFSIEVCGGPHVKSTGELGSFKITKEEASSAGIRRIKAVLK